MTIVSPSSKFDHPVHHPHGSKRSILISLIMALVGCTLLVILITVYFRNKSEKMLAEVGNVGGGATLKIYDWSEKPPHCRSSKDCPPETVCSHEGVCVPEVHVLPKSL
jgi:hypothetical protein